MSEDKVGGNFDLSVECDNCQKWRKVHSSTDISFLPKKWFCRLNIDSNHNSCDVPEEEEDDGCTCTVAKKNRSVGTLGKKQTDRDVVCRVCTRLVQIQRDSPRIREI